MGGPVPHSQHPAGWYRTMDRGFAVDHFGFPALPRRGERHTAPDGSVWEFALTGTDWWELAEYAPSETDRSIGTFHDDARFGRETLRIIDRALWVDHGTGNLDALTPELPIWADEWAERIVAAVNGQPAEASTPEPEVVAEYLADQIAGDFYGPNVRGPVNETFIEGDVDLVEVAKGLMQRFDITERPSA